MIISQGPQMEVSRKREVESIDGVPRVTTNPFLAEKQDVERVAKMQKVESKEGKPHLTTNLSLAEKQEVETAKKPHSKNKNKEVAKPVESLEASKNSSDPDDWVEDDDDDNEQWPLVLIDELHHGYSDSGYSDSDDETYKKWKEEDEARYIDSDSEGETHTKSEEENED